MAKRITKKINLKVLDISHHNTIVSFQKMYDFGIRGVILKSTQGSHYVDRTYERRVKQARDAGLLTGAYHFATGDNVEAQVRNMLDVVEIDDKTLVALDYEPNRASEMSLSQCREFFEHMDTQLGRKTVLYSGNLIKETLSKPDPIICNRKLWLAQYGSSYVLPVGFADCWLWQYAEKGAVPGITGAIDHNSFDGTDEDLALEWAE